MLFTLAASDVGDNFKEGVAVFSFSGTQLAIAEGYYEGEISITYSSGSVETIFEILSFNLSSGPNMIADRTWTTSALRCWLVLYTTVSFGG